jgi:hypothetical protein
MAKLGVIVLFMGVILSFHDTYWPYAIWGLVGWALLASLDYNIRKWRA